jgi:hypothetical protein
VLLANYPAGYLAVALQPEFLQYFFELQAYHFQLIMAIASTRKNYKNTPSTFRLGSKDLTGASENSKIHM